MTEIFNSYCAPNLQIHPRLNPRKRPLLIRVVVVRALASHMPSARDTHRQGLTHVGDNIQSRIRLDNSESNKYQCLGIHTHSKR